jgi:serine/threonine-protein kinase
MSVELPTFWEGLRESGLLPPEQVRELAGDHALSGDATIVARQLVQRGLLTWYQAARLAEGQGRELAFGVYSILDRLGEGVFKARHRDSQRVVYLRIFPRDYLANADAVRRFQRAVQAAAKVIHPSLVQILNAGQVAGVGYCALEPVEGVDLARLVNKSGPLAIAQACECVRQVALGLQRAHEHGLVHHAVKPENIILQEGSEATTRKVVLGMPDFGAPGRDENGSHGNNRLDLYDLGCTLYFLLTGLRTNRNESLASGSVHAQEALPLEQQRLDLPPELAAMVGKLLAKKLDERYQTPAEVA